MAKFCPQTVVFGLDYVIFKHTVTQKIEVLGVSRPNFPKMKWHNPVRRDTSENKRLNRVSCLGAHALYGEAGFVGNNLLHDIGVSAVILLAARLWVKLFDYLTQNNFIEQKVSRKIVHISSGLFYVLCWPFYSGSQYSRYFAALIPMANGIRLLMLGFGINKDEGVVKSVSRHGDPKELLRGPLYYVSVLFFATIFFWRESPIPMIALAIMCGGDGLADIVGRRFGAIKLQYNTNKSWAGSLAMFVGGFVITIGLLYYFSSLGFYHFDMEHSSMHVALISFLATVLESLPITSKFDDNIVVPVSVMVLSSILFP